MAVNSNLNAGRPLWALCFFLCHLGAALHFLSTATPLNSPLLTHRARSATIPASPTAFPYRRAALNSLFFSLYLFYIYINKNFVNL